MFRPVARLAVVAAVVVTSGAMSSVSAMASTVSAQANKGTVDLSVGTADAGETSVYTVHFRGPISDHGWSHTGTLTAVGSTWSWAGSMSNIPILSVSSDDGTVSGTCGTVSQAASVDEALIGDGPALDLDFGCVLSRSGSTPWEITLQSAVTQLTAGAPWTGSYVEGDTATTQVNTRSLTYGEVQLGDSSGEGYPQYGPLRFSGQIDIGGNLYRGDLVSGVSDPVASNDIPPLAVSGSSNGVTVSGTCAGTYDETSAQADVSSYEFSCTLAAGNAAPVTVSLNAVFTTGTGACSYRDCWGDSEGYFTSG